MRLKKMNILRKGTISLQGTLVFYLHVLAQGLIDVVL